MSSTLIWILVGGVAFSLLGGAAATIAVVKLPKDYFTRNPNRARKRKGWMQEIAWVARNVLGIVLILGGLVLMFPGVPGPGVVVILLGLTITDIPGKHELLVALVRKRFVMKSMNKVRRRFRRPDLATP
ncbi:MAG TPA: hypothetical protein VE981_21625 [Planctomycetota bacterium]|nr:hypothetical protein [Planctomycetota bacterium]